MSSDLTLNWKKFEKNLALKLDRDLNLELESGEVWDSLDHLVVITTLANLAPGVSQLIVDFEGINNILELKKRFIDLEIQLTYED